MAAKKKRAAKEPRDTRAVVREMCTWLPETEELISHGSLSFKGAKKVFAMFEINHHGDGRVALWLAAPAGNQEHYVDSDAKHYFVPPYVGPKGWLGVNLNTGLDWQRVAEHVREAFLCVVPKRLADLPDTPEIAPPDVEMDPYDIDPLSHPDRQPKVAALAGWCMALPEVVEGQQFGNPCWKAGKKTFATAHHSGGHLKFSFWVGGERQSMLADDPRYKIPSYTGPNGWIELDVENHLMAEEVEGLVRESYEHFALKRMLKALEAR